MRKSLIVFYYSICLVLIIAYMCLFFLVFKNDYTYSYQIYYIEAKTKYWYGYNGLNVNFGESFYYDEDNITLNGLQYMGKDFEFITDKTNETRKNYLTGVEITKSSTLFFEITNEIEEYIIILETNNKENDLVFLLNGKKVETFNKENGKYTLFINDIKKENILNIKSDRNVMLNMLRFEEI